jgi:hypothetical protein
MIGYPHQLQWQMRILKITSAVIGILLILAVILIAIFYGRQIAGLWSFYQSMPDHDFDPAMAVAVPDYAQQEYWAALPQMTDPADLIPDGIDATDIQGNAAADVFFIHPTGYLSSATWTSPLNPDSAAEENTKWMMANQASTFNGCCNVYAPRYREGSIILYFGDAARREAILKFAYADVERAFDYFIENYSDGRPFIIASHSQGTHHARRLLKSRIDGTPLYARMVAAYTIGSVNIHYSSAYFASLNQIKPCESASGTGCVVHWDTFADGSPQAEKDTLCTNPLTWQVNEDLAEAALNAGHVPPNVPYNVNLSKDNAPSGVVFNSLAAPQPQHTWAQCRSGSLFVALQDEGVQSANLGQGSYHGLDYALFYMDIRANAKHRVEQWFARQEL